MNHPPPYRSPLRLQWCLVSVATTLFSLNAFADDAPDCVAPTSQAEMSYCAGLDYETADNRLNEIWPDIVAAARERDVYIAEQATSMGVPTTEQALVAAQRAWIRFRDAHCTYESYEVFGGTAQSMVGSLCLAELTRQRIEVLSRALEPR